MGEDDPYEWLGDSIYTNLQELAHQLHKANYFVEVLSQPYTCIESSNYKVLIVFDIEDYFTE